MLSSKNRVATTRRPARSPALDRAVRLPGYSPPKSVPATMIRLINAKKNYGRQTLYDGIEVSIVRGERIGLLGKNGAGKSTFFKILLGVEHLDSGEVLRDRKCSIGYLPQEIHPLKEG